MLCGPCSPGVRLKQLKASLALNEVHHPAGCRSGPLCNSLHKIVYLKGMCRCSPCVIYFLSEIHQRLSSLFCLSLLLFFFRWSLRSPPRPLHRFTSSPLWVTVTSPLLVSSLWCARARWLSTHLMWPCPQSQSAWDLVSRAPASTWRALCGKKRRTVRKHHV